MKLPRFNETSYGHFITTKTFDNKPIFRDDTCCLTLLENIDFYRGKLGFKFLGYVIMPDHFHCIIWWDVEKYRKLTISKIIQSIKSHSARQIVDYLYQSGRRGPLTSPPNNSLGQGTQATHGRYPRHRMSEQKYRIWQSSFYDFNIYSEEKMNEKLDYMHYNPVRAGLCKNSEDWPWSSYRDYEFGQVGKIKIDKL